MERSKQEHVLMEALNKDVLQKVMQPVLPLQQSEGIIITELIEAK